MVSPPTEKCNLLAGGVKYFVFKGSVKEDRGLILHMPRPSEERTCEEPAEAVLMRTLGNTSHVVLGFCFAKH